MAQQDERMTIYLRTSKELHTWLSKLAEKNSRSLNNQVEYLLLQVKEGHEAKPLIEELKELLAKARKK